jgi:hypothetical protein
MDIWAVIISPYLRLNEQFQRHGTQLQSHYAEAGYSVSQQNRPMEGEGLRG